MNTPKGKAVQNVMLTLMNFPSPEDFKSSGDLSSFKYQCSYLLISYLTLLVILDNTVGWI